MNFDTLDRRMRGFENSIDRKMPDGCYIVARLDGHRFTNIPGLLIFLSIGLI